MATNVDLPKLVQARRFREDLFYRINVVSIKIPPLRDRQQDIPWLMERFFAESVGRMETSLKGISSLTEEAALYYGWPGNIRELRNRIERAVALGLGQWVMPGDMFPEESDEADCALQMGSLEDVRQSAEKRHIIRALTATSGEVGAASKLLGIGRTTLWEKMRRLGLSGA
ncbi:transcriptional regulatory protein ZraR [mine drainage metagenome]|uniref:Transcriptional regulatory protein ZraR n=1 Tax=mine drainage metagenome TaxID=410659 RepID=A0A1J5PRK0_9ZZZZ